MYIPSNFTVAMAQKSSSPTDPNVQYQSTVHLYLDMSNYQVTILIEQEVLAAFESKQQNCFYWFYFTDTFLSDMLNSTFNINLSPVTVDEAVYGSTDIQFKNFLAPGMHNLTIHEILINGYTGMIALICFAHSIGITAVGM